MQAVLPATQVRITGRNCRLSLRFPSLSQLAGWPTKEHVIHVFGDAGVAWTWVAGANAVGMKLAEEVARRCPELLKKPSKSSLVAGH